MSAHRRGGGNGRGKHIGPPGGPPGVWVNLVVVQELFTNEPKESISEVKMWTRLDIDTSTGKSTGIRYCRQWVIQLTITNGPQEQPRAGDMIMTGMGNGDYPLGSFVAGYTDYPVDEYIMGILVDSEVIDDQLYYYVQSVRPIEGYNIESARFILTNVEYYKLPEDINKPNTGETT